MKLDVNVADTEGNILREPKKFVFLTRSTPQRRQGGCGAVEANRTLPLVNEIAGAPMSQKTESAAQTLVESLGPIPGLTYFSRRFHCEECEIAQNSRLRSGRALTHFCVLKSVPHI